jgi:2-hydroxycyclohexanecarboxyl-CoA dehydrogenase
VQARFEADGDVIVVTGGANGIGRALARAAAQAGARVVVCDVDETAMVALSDISGILTRRLDVADRAQVFAVLGDVERQFGKIDGLVCAAAIQPRVLVREMEAAAWERCCGSISTAWCGAIRRWSRA